MDPNDRRTWPGGPAKADAEALQFLQALGAYYNRRQSRIRLALIASVVFPFACWWVYFFLAAPGFDFWVTKLLTSLLFPPSILTALVIWWFSCRTRDRFRADAAGGELWTVGGRFKKKVWQKEAGDRILAVDVEGLTVYLPYRWYASLPAQGEAEFTFLPHSRYCWTSGGSVVWRHKDYRFW